MSKRNNIFPSGVSLCSAGAIVLCRKRTKDKRIHSCCGAFLLCHQSRVGDWGNPEAVGDHGSWRNTFSVGLPFLKRLSWRIFWIISELRSPSFDCDSVKIKHFPGCLGFYHLQVGHYGPGAGLQEDKTSIPTALGHTHIFTETTEFSYVLLTSHNTLLNHLGI